MLRLFDVHIAKKHLLSKDNGCFLEIKKAETVASTFDMMLMIIENRIKEWEDELSETHNLVES